MRPASSSNCRFEETVDCGSLSASAMSLTLTPMPRCSSFRIWTRSGEASPLRTSGRSSGSMTRKLRAIRPFTPVIASRDWVCIRLSDMFIKSSSPRLEKPALSPQTPARRKPLMPTANSPPRRILSLNGRWDFSFEGPTARLQGEHHSIRVPAIWQTQFPELRNAHGTGHYVRQIELPADWAADRVVLVMEGVFHEATILVDQTPVAANRNGWTEIEVDLTEVLNGAKRFTLGVIAHVPDDRDYQRSSFGQSLAAKQDWYGIHGGVWKPARLERRNPLHLKEVAIEASTDLRSHDVSVKGALSLEKPAKIRIEVGRQGTIVAQQEFALHSKAFELRLPVAEVELWSPDAPNLYQVVVSAISDDAIVDAIERNVGFRLFESRDAGLFLNGRPFYMFGALDQDWYAEEDCRHPDEAFLEQ